MNQDESQGPAQPFLQGQEPQQPTNQLGRLSQQPQNPNITKQQLIAGLHHLSSFTQQFAPLLQNPTLGKGNIRPKIFDAAANLIGAGIFTVPEVINGIKDLPDDPIGQKKWLETKLMNTKLAEQKLVQDYIAQGPGASQGPEWTPDNHKEHMTGLMGSYKRG